MNHSVRKASTNGACRVIYHAHTPALIALTYVLPLTAKDFTRALWQSAECPVVFPGGVGVVQWMVPGGSGYRNSNKRADERIRCRRVGRIMVYSAPAPTLTSHSA